MEDTIPTPLHEQMAAGRPVDPATGKPAMAATEASWHEHIAAQRGAVEGANDTAEPGAAAALLAASQGASKEISGIAFRPLDVGVFWALQKAGSVFTRENPDGVEIPVSMGDIGLAAYIFAEPDEAFSMLENEAHEELRLRAFALARKLDRSGLEAFTAHIHAELGKWTKGS